MPVFAAVITHHHTGLAALDHYSFQFPRHADASERVIGHQRQALTGTIIDDSQDAEAAAVGQLIRLHGALSSMAWARSRFSFVFSFSSVLSHLASETSIPPNLV